MEIAALITIIIFSIPVFTAVTGVLIMSLTNRGRLSGSEHTAKKILMCYFVLKSWLWFTFILYSFHQSSFIYLTPSFYLVYFMLQVLFYRFVYCLTKQEGDEGFPAYHYIIVVVVFIIFQIWALIIPEESKGYIAEYSSFNTVQNKYVLFSLLNELMKILRVLYAIFYMVLSCNLIYYSSQSSEKIKDKRSSWLYYAMFVYVITTLFSVSGFFGSLPKSYNVLLALPVMLLEASLHLILLYNTIHGNVLLKASVNKPFHDDYATVRMRRYNVNRKRRIKKKEQLNKSDFEKYMKSKKPYLDPNFKITDLEELFRVNRSYISAFINSNYGMNFSRIVNKYRLMEFDGLTQMVEHQGKTIAQRAQMAGFGSYNNYLRAKQQEKAKQPENGTIKE